MNKFLNSDWLRGVQFFRNKPENEEKKTVQKKEIQCKFLNFLNFLIS